MRALSPALLPQDAQWQKPEEEQRGEREATKPSKTTHCEGDGLGEGGPGGSDFRDASESASAWLVSPVGGPAGDRAQGRTKLEAPFRQSGARVQREQGGAGAGRTRALCARGHRDVSPGLPAVRPRVRSEIRSVAGELRVGTAPTLRN